jgi:hypothetical protein
MRDAYEEDREQNAVGPDDWDETLCLQCEEQIPHGREFCDAECEQAWYAQARAERKLR